MLTILVCLAIGGLAWGCLGLIAAAYGLVLPTLHPWAILITVQAGPPLLFVCATIAWARARAWRRMDDMRTTPIGSVSTRLARGQPAVVQSTGQKSVLEWCAIQMIWLSIIATPFWLGLGYPLAWIGAGVATYWLTRACLR
ncbi:MAG: hypothetical protein AAGF94_16655 [Pseudomonadota bacterium]